MRLWEDARTRLILDDTAASGLEGLHPAAIYRPTELRVAAMGRAPIRKNPDLNAEQADELIFGEAFEVLFEERGFAFGQAVRDGYVGWVRTSDLGPPTSPPTHRVSALATFAFSLPSIKSRPLHRLPLNALAAVAAQDGRFMKVEGSGWVAGEHLSPIGAFQDDPAATALGFLGAPYLWGGRTVGGVDCSGLVQQALYACGLACPRDSDQQGRLGAPLAVGADLAGLRRTDLVIWPGHIGMMVDQTRLLHANAHAMSVSVESLEDAVKRIGGPGPAFRRLTIF